MTTDDAECPQPTAACIQPTSAPAPFPGSKQCFLYAIGAVALLSFCLVAAAYLHTGFDLVVKIITGLILPVGFIWLFFFACGVWWAFKRQRTASLLFFALWLTVGVTFNGRVGQKLISSIEAPVKSFAPDTFPLRAVVVLGGGASVNSFGTDELNCDGERVMSAAQMWHAGETRVIICTGGEGNPKLDGSSVGRRLLRSVGIPDDAILEVPGYNTVREMTSLKKLFESQPEVLGGTGKVGLITSAFHMNRAMRLANGQELEFLPFPCCYRSSFETPLTPRDLIPHVEGGINVAITLKEWLAAVAGR